MKKTTKLFTALVCVAAFSAPAVSEEKNAPPPPPAHGGMPGMGNMGGGMGMMGGMSDEQMDAHLRQMQERMLRDYDFMHQIRDSKDEKEQARLKDEWLQAMKQHRKTTPMPQQLKMHGMPEKAPDK